MKFKLKRRLYAISICCFLLSLNIYAQIPELNWVQTSGGAYIDRSDDIAVDMNGNVFISGQYFPSTVIGNDTLIYESNLKSNFIAKYDNLGNFKWAKRIGASTSDFPNHLKVDKSGSSYVVGTFSGEQDFGGIRLISKSTSNTSHDIFIARYSPLSKLLWVHQIQQVDNGFGPYSYEHNIDEEGNCYVTGSFTGEISFGNFTLKNQSGVSAFLAKYDTYGKFLWAKQIVSKQCYILSVAVTVNGSCYLTGKFQGELAIANNILTAKGEEDFFVAKMNNMGDPIWIRQGSGSVHTAALALGIDPDDNCYVVGRFKGVLKIDEREIDSNNEREMFLAKYKDSGDLEWIRTVKTHDEPDLNFHINVDTEGSSYIFGTFFGKAIFDDFTLIDENNANIFIAKFNKNGNFIRADKIVAENSTTDGHIANVAGFAMDSYGNSYITGYFYGKNNLNGKPLTSKGDADIYIAKYDNTIVPTIDSNLSELGIYPSPTNDLITIAGTKVISSITLHDIGSRLVLFKSPGVASTHLDVQHLNSGLYFLKIEFIDGTFVLKKIVKE